MEKNNHNNIIIKHAFIKKLNDGKYRVMSENGKNLGTYDSLKAAKKRLRQVEFFKHKKASVDLTDVDSFSLSGIMRKLNETEPEKALVFLKLFKSNFDKAIKDKLQQPDKVSLQNTVVEFAKEYPIKLNKDVIKSAAITELGDASTVAGYMIQVIRLFLLKIKPENRASAAKKIKEKIWAFSDLELSNKNMPASSAIGQSIGFVKGMLFNHDPKYIRSILNNIVRVL